MLNKITCEPPIFQQIWPINSKMWRHKPSKSKWVETRISVQKWRPPTNSEKPNREWQKSVWKHKLNWRGQVHSWIQHCHPSRMTSQWSKLSDLREKPEIWRILLYGAEFREWNPECARSESKARLTRPKAAKKSHKLATFWRNDAIMWNFARVCDDFVENRNCKQNRSDKSRAWARKQSNQPGFVDFYKFLFCNSKLTLTT